MNSEVNMTLKKLEAAFASPLFLATAILYSASFAIGLSAGGFDVISLLIVIGMWLAFAAAKGGKLSEKQTGIKMLSGCIKAQFIIMWVIIGAVVSLSVILMAVGPAFLHELGNITLSGMSIDGYINSITPGHTVYDYYDAELASGIFIGVVSTVMFLCVVVCTLINIFYIRNLHKLTKSVCVSFETGNVKLEKLQTVKIWMIVLAVLTGIGALNSLLYAQVVGLGSGCSCAAMILVVIMLSKLESEDGEDISDISESSDSDIPSQL